MDKEKPDKKVPEPEDQIKKAREEAENDIEKDPSVNMKPKPLEDLDEGELARLEGLE